MKNKEIVKIEKKMGKVVKVKLPDKVFIGKSEYTKLLNLDPDYSVGTEFQQKVWRYLRNVPCGKTVTYKEVADGLGLGRSYRAIGQACKSNPMPIVIPCHRVVASGGGLGGYSRGLKWKRFLIGLENNRS